MITVRIAFAVIAAALLVACQSKQKVNTKQVLEPSDTTTAVLQLPDDLLELQTLTGEFINYAVQKFIVPKSKTATVTGKKGLKVTVNPSVLEKADGTEVDGSVEVRMVELTNSNDLFKVNAATVSNGRLLVSGGSYYLEMLCNGQKLQIKKTKHINIDFPVVSNDEMELYYGQRDSSGNINWLTADNPLQIAKTKPPVADEVMFTDSNVNKFNDFAPSFMYDTNGNVKIYRTTKEQVYLYENRITIEQLVDTVNKKEFRIFIDTVYMWPKRPDNLPAGARIDSIFLYQAYGPPKQFILKHCKDATKEKIIDEELKEAAQAARQKRQPKTLAGQLFTYYNTASITSLGWLNCDRLYNGPQNSDVEVELPITLNKSTMHYFLIFKEFAGLLSGRINGDSLQQYRLAGLPNNQQITLVAFVKANDKIYQFKKDFTVARNTVLKTDFKEVSSAELKKIFGNNIKI